MATFFPCHTLLLALNQIPICCWGDREWVKSCVHKAASSRELLKLNYSQLNYNQVKDVDKNQKIDYTKLAISSGVRSISSLKGVSWSSPLSSPVSSANWASYKIIQKASPLQQPKIEWDCFCLWGPQQEIGKINKTIPFHLALHPVHLALNGIVFPSKKNGMNCIIPYTILHNITKYQQ